MKTELFNYKIGYKNFLGNILQIMFVNTANSNDKKILVLNDLVGFIDTLSNDSQMTFLRIDYNGGSYNFELAIKLGQMEINDFPELFIFTDSNCHICRFRAVARHIEFRDLNDSDTGNVSK